MWGAFDTRLPSGPKSAQEKSSRSLMLTEMEVRCSARPICSAMLMKRCEKMASWMGSHSRELFLFREDLPTAMRTSPREVMCAWQAGSTTIVEMSSMSSAGPSSSWPAASVLSRYTGVCCRPPISKYMDTTIEGSGIGPGTPVSASDPAYISDRPVARTRTSSAKIRRFSSTKPNSRLYSASKADLKFPSAGVATMTATSVPS
mmetsp:Transcript_21034/g.53938  ORF Transcript_21034/g.53938 Transcript_21034/m.53938 type:complete len:203 (-) Transcript_21034:4-612(-)